MYSLHIFVYFYVYARRAACTPRWRGGTSARCIFIYPFRYLKSAIFGIITLKIQQNRRQNIHPAACALMTEPMSAPSDAVRGYAYLNVDSSETVNFLRPFARRAANTLRPLAVAIL